jgi:hypothetical protein
MSNNTNKTPKIDPEELKKAVNIQIGKPLTEEEFKAMCQSSKSKPQVYKAS